MIFVAAHKPERRSYPEQVNMALVREDFRAGVGMKNRQRLVLGSLRKDYDDGNENGKKAIGLDKQNNNFARASRFFVHFSAVVARLQRETA